MVCSRAKSTCFTANPTAKNYSKATNLITANKQTEGIRKLIYIKAPRTKTDTTNKPILLQDTNGETLQYLSPSNPERI